MVESLLPPAPVLRALLYLRGMMLRNIVLTSVRRLRHPRYLLGTVIALAYIWFAFIARADRPRQGPPVPIPTEGLELIFALVLGGVLIYLWFMPDDKPGLRFTEAETAFLFPAPFTRRQLIHYKLLSGLGASLLSSLFFTLMMARAATGWSSVLRSISTWWVINANISMHMIAAALVLARWSGHGRLLVVRRYAVGALFLLYIGVASYLGIHEDFALLTTLATPLRWLVHAFVATGFDFATSLVLLLVVLALQYRWVLTLETPFEENSLSLATRQAEVLAKMRSGKFVWARKQTARREPFRLRQWMPIELVLLWKQLLALPAFLRGRTFVGIAALIVVATQWLQHSAFADKGAVISAIALGFLVYLQFLVPLATRFDLNQVDQMRAWPVPGWRIVLGSMLSPVVVMTATGVLLLLLAALSMPPQQSQSLQWLTRSLQWALMCSICLVLPAFTLLQLVGPYATALFFPAWTLSLRPGQRGFDAMGGRLLLMIGQMLLIAIAVIPAVIAAGLGFFFSRWFTGMTGGVVLASACAALTLLLEALYGVYLLGERFERLDVTAELRQ